MRNYCSISSAEEHYWQAFDGCNANGQKILENMQKFAQAPKTVQLKIATQVILLANVNVSQGLCNGSRGVVSWFCDTRLPEARAQAG